MTRPPRPPTAPPRAPREEEYKGAPLTAERQPENRVMVLLDADGFVCRGVLVKGQEGEFMPFMRQTRQPIDPNDIALPPGYTLDAEGRAIKEVVDSAGTLKARLTTEDIILR